jgi:hypothetical protein
MLANCTLLDTGEGGGVGRMILLLFLSNPTKPKVTNQGSDVIPEPIKLRNTLEAWVSFRELNVGFFNLKWNRCYLVGLSIRLRLDCDPRDIPGHSTQSNSAKALVGSPWWAVLSEDLCHSIPPSLCNSLFFDWDTGIAITFHMVTIIGCFITKDFGRSLTRIPRFKPTPNLTLLNLLSNILNWNIRLELYRQIKEIKEIFGLCEKIAK